MHQTQRVPHRLGTQYSFTRDGADAAVGQGGRHDAGALTGHLNGAELEIRTKNSGSDYKHLQDFIAATSKERVILGSDCTNSERLLNDLANNLPASGPVISGGNDKQTCNAMLCLASLHDRPT